MLILENRLVGSGWDSQQISRLSSWDEDVACISRAFVYIKAEMKSSFTNIELYEHYGDFSQLDGVLSLLKILAEYCRSCVLTEFVLELLKPNLQKLRDISAGVKSNSLSLFEFICLTLLYLRTHWENVLTDENPLNCAESDLFFSIIGHKNMCGEAHTFENPSIIGFSPV